MESARLKDDEGGKLESIPEGHKELRLIQSAREPKFQRVDDTKKEF